MKKIRICGLGGQGIILAGEILGLAAVIEGKYATQMRSYGSEARGSACKSDIIISEKEIKYPVIDECDILIALSQPALKKYVKTLKRGGILIIDEDLIKKLPQEDNYKIYKIKATRIAEKRFRRIMANMIILGYTSKKTGIIKIESLKKAVQERGIRMKEMNKKAIIEGSELAEK